MSGEGVRVAIIDSGWESGRLDRRVIPGVSILRSNVMEPGADDVLGHGTLCTLQILATAPCASVLPIKIFDRSLEASLEQLETAAEWLVRIGAVDVVCLSLSTMRFDLAPKFEELCTKLEKNGIVIVASADNRSGGGLPAVLRSVLGVVSGGFESLDQFWYLNGEAVELVASARAVDDRFRKEHGISGRMNSLAAATMTGIVASIISKDGRLSLLELREKLRIMAIRTL